jgi:glycosyltransferase involved in cell wall biosynthesis
VRGRIRQARIETKKTNTVILDQFIPLSAPEHGTRRLVANRPLRIAYISHTLFRGGAEVATLELCREFNKRKIDLYFLNIPANNDPQHQMLQKDMGAICKYRYEVVKDGKGRVEYLRKYILSVNPDVIIFNNVANVAETCEGMLNHPPIIHYSHSNLGDTVAMSKEGILDAVIVLSEQMKQSHIDQGIDVNKIHVISNGIDPARVTNGKSLRTELKIPDKAIVIGMVGNLNSLKRPLMGLEAFARLKNPNVYMIFVGNPADQGTAVEILAKDKYGCLENIRILGIRPDIENVYATLDILLNCSTSEGLPMTIIEAMHNSIPVIASSVGGNPALVQHGFNGWLFQSDDKDELFFWMTDLVGSSQVRKTYGINAKELAKKYTIKKTADAVLDVAKSLTLKQKDITVSVVMPCYNCEKTLENAMDSVLCQTLDTFELICVDDGSTDKTSQMLVKYQDRDSRVRVLKQEHAGIVTALNYGCANAKTDLIARMDSDDIALPSRLEKQVKFLVENDDIDIIGSFIRPFTDHHEIRPDIILPTNHTDIVEWLKTNNAMAHSTTMYRKEIWERVGGYKGDGRAEDYRFWCSAVLAGAKLANINEVLLYYRIKDNKTYHAWVTSVNADIQKFYTEGLKKR